MLFAIGMALFLAACNGKENLTPEVNPEFDSADLTVSKPATAGNGYSIAIKASDDVEWQASVDAGEDWITLSSASGKGSGKVMYDLLANQGTQKRSTVVSIVAKSNAKASFSATKKVTVTQMGTEPYLTITPSGEQSEGADADDAYSVQVASNVAWTASLADTPDWIAITSGSAGEGMGEIVLAITENASGAIRTATLTVASNENPELKASLSLSQLFKGITYTVFFDGMSGYLAEGSYSMTLSNGTARSIDVIVSCSDEGTAIEFESILEEGLWTITKIGDKAVDIQFTVGAGGLVTSVETWNQAFGCFGGDSAERPIRISNEAGILALAQCVADSNLFVGKFLLQTVDIALTSENWPGIGSPNRKFGGSYDGGNHTISGLKFTTNDSGTSDENRGHALFNHIKGRGAAMASIRNLTVVGAGDDAIVAGYGFASALVAHVADSVTIENCSSNANIKACGSFTANGGASVGGLIGWASGKEIVIRGCSNYGAISAGDISVLANNVGGLIGNVSGTDDCPIKVENCANFGELSVRGNSGGVLGNASSNAELKCLANYGKVKSTGGNARLGGVVGSMSSETVSLSESFNKGVIDGLVNTGGVAGYIETGATVQNCYNAGAMTVTGNNPNNGGVVGHKKDTKSVVKNCYNCAQMTGNDDKTNFGGVLGSNLGTATDVQINVSACVYESGKGAVKALAKNPDNTVDASIASAKTYEEMTNGSIFTSWDKDVWNFAAGKYPVLKNNPEVQ